MRHPKTLQLTPIHEIALITSLSIAALCLVTACENDDDDMVETEQTENALLVGGGFSFPLCNVGQSKYYITPDNNCGSGTETCPMANIADALEDIEAGSLSVVCPIDIYLSAGDYKESINIQRSGIRLNGTGDTPYRVNIHGNISNGASRLKLNNLRVYGYVYNSYASPAVEMTDVVISNSPSRWAYYQRGGSCDINGLKISSSAAVGAYFEGNAEVSASNVTLQFNKLGSWFQRGGVLKGENWNLSYSQGEGLWLRDGANVTLNNLEAYRIDGAAVTQRGGVLVGSDWELESNGSAIKLLDNAEMTLTELEVRFSKNTAIGQVGGVLKGSDWRLTWNENGGVVVEDGYFNVSALASKRNHGRGFVARGQDTQVYLRDSEFSLNTVDGDCTDPMASLGILFEEGALGGLYNVKTNDNEGPGLVARGAGTVVNYSNLEANRNRPNECYQVGFGDAKPDKSLAGIYIADNALFRGRRLDVIENQVHGLSVENHAKAYLFDTLIKKTLEIPDPVNTTVGGINIAIKNYAKVELCHVESSFAPLLGVGIFADGYAKINYGLIQSNLIGANIQSAGYDMSDLLGSSTMLMDCRPCNAVDNCRGFSNEGTLFRDNARDIDGSLPIPQSQPEATVPD